MTDLTQHKKQLLENGFTIFPKTYSSYEVEEIIKGIEKIDTTKKTVRKSVDLFVIRKK